MAIIEYNGNTVNAVGIINSSTKEYSAGTNIDITDDIISVTGITVPTKVSELENDSNYISEETDPIWQSEKDNYALKEEDLGGLKLVSISQADYDALEEKDSSTLYIINDN